MSSTEHTLGSAEIQAFLCKRDSNRDPSKHYAAMDLSEKNPPSGAQSEVKLLKPTLSLSSISMNEDENTFAETSSTRTTDEDTLDDISSCPSPQRLSLIYQQILEIGIRNMYCTLTRELKTFMSILCSILSIRFRKWTISGTDVLRSALKSIPSPAIHSFFRVLQSSATRFKTALVRLPTLFIVLGKIPGVVAAGCQFGVDDFSLSVGSILDQISGQTLLLSVGATFGGSQSFANDHRLAFGLLSIGVAGMNGAHSASKLLSQRGEIPIYLTENERNDLHAGPWRYAGLVARLLRLFWTSLTSIAIGICTCYLVAIGWSVVLVLTIALVIYGETYAPLKLVIYENFYYAPFMCYRDDGSSAVDWRYTITPHGSYIVHNNSLQSKFSHRRTTPVLPTDWVRLELKTWNGTYFASGLSFVTWIWWLLSLQLLTPWSWAPRFIILAGVLSLLIAEWCNSVDAQESSYGFSRRVLTIRSKLQELTFMYIASGVEYLLNKQERMVMTKMVAETMIASGELNEVSSRLESSHANDTPTVVGTKLHEFYTMAVPLSPILQHEKERLGVIGNPWPHMGVVEWAIAWTIELAEHAVSCSLYLSEMKGYYQCNLGPANATLIACSAMSHKSCDAIRRFSKEATAVWHQQLWKFAALAQVCARTHPQLARRAARCSPADHLEGLKLWSEYLFGEQGWDPCIVLLVMIRSLSREGAITYGAYNIWTISADVYVGCKTERSHNTTIIRYGKKIVELHRDIPIPLAAPPRFSVNGRLIAMTESAVKAEKRILSYLRSSAPHLLETHLAHALLDYPGNDLGEWTKGSDGKPILKKDLRQTG